MLIINNYKERTVDSDRGVDSSVLVHHLLQQLLVRAPGVVVVINSGSEVEVL